MSVQWAESMPNSTCAAPPVAVDNISSHRQGYKSTHPTSLPVIDLLLVLLYVIIVCDVFYILVIYYLVPATSTTRRRMERMQILKKSNSGQAPVSSKKKNLTLDHLWKRLKAEARHLKAINSRHRMITLAMMESRLHARSLERERSLTRSTRSKMEETKEDESITMAQWAARIVAEHDPRRK